MFILVAETNNPFRGNFRWIRALDEHQQSSGKQKACQSEGTNRQVSKGDDDNRIEEGLQQETTQKSRQNGQIISECVDGTQEVNY